MIDAAVELFAKNGFESTRLEDIAKHAGVSTATYYNYFPTKGHLISELYRDDLDRIQGNQECIIANPPEDPVDAIVEMLKIEVKEGYGFKDRLVWREIYSAAITFNDEVMNIVDPLHAYRSAPYKQLLQKLIDMGKLPSSTDINNLSEVICCVNESHFLSRLLDEDLSNGEIISRLRRNVAAIIPHNLPA